MKEIGGFTIPGLPITGLKHVRDLLYHEGPLLSQYAHPNGDTYLHYWCDCDEMQNRWMVLRVNEAMVLRLVNHFLPLDQVVPQACRDDFVYFVDTDGRETRSVKMVAMADIPPDYLPQPGAYLEVEQRLEMVVAPDEGVLLDAVDQYAAKHELPNRGAVLRVALSKLLKLPLEIPHLGWKPGRARKPAKHR